MTTVKVKFRPSRVKGREGVLCLQLIHCRTVRLITTKIKLFPWEWDATESRIVIDGTDIERAVILYISRKKLENELCRLEDIIERLERGLSYKVDDVIEYYTGKYCKSLFFDFMQKRIDSLVSSGQYRTSQTHKTTMKVFADFVKNWKLRLDDIDSPLMCGFEEYLQARKITKNSTSFYMRILKSVYNRAVTKEIIEDKQPFRKVYTGVSKTEKRAVSNQIITLLKEFDHEDPKLLFARDMFLFSFFARGISFVDLFHLKKSDINHNILTYRRVKTGQKLSVRVEECMWKIINGYSHSLNDHLFPFAIDSSKVVYKQYINALRLQNNRLQTISTLLNLDIPLTSYVSRHSWASIAKSKGIAVSVISESMGHTSEATTKIYLASFEQNVIDKANLTVISDL